ncbi:MAG: transposase [Clostridia bacterium]|nr:transposase [Clostridia bacterium]
MEKEPRIFKQRKPTRLKEYDYSSNGRYFVTICVQDRKLLLGSVVVGDGVLDVPKMRLSRLGLIAEKYIQNMSHKYDGVSVEDYVIMPNHIHLVIGVLNQGTSRTPSPTNQVIPKFVSSFKRFCNREYGYNIWQRSYHDRIIRNDAEYKKIHTYIKGNPIVWQKDKFFVE